ncbi:MAG: hypothetical protein HGGPFJEG_02003 [Ignavibacteria bacterium]|nr:hypothetical protein [Ignavibacteria bacterium]
MHYNTEYILNSFAWLIKDWLDAEIDSVKELKADASDRKIYRLISGSKSFIGVFNENVKENRAFIYFSKLFHDLKLNVPEIHCVSADENFYLEEDLGDTTLFGFSINKSYSELTKYYRQAVKDLIGFQLNTKDHIDYSYCIGKGGLDSSIINSDLNKFYNYFVKKFHKKKSGKIEIEYNQITELSEIFSNVNEQTEKSFFMYRDFQPRNIMLRNEKLYYIDYQSGMKGPLQYDLVSFLYSGSVFLKEEEKEELLDYYLLQISNKIKLDTPQFRNTFYYYALLRIFQVLGSYGYQYEQKNNKNMLLKMKKALSNLDEMKKSFKNKKVSDFVESLLANANPDKNVNPS